MESGTPTTCTLLCNSSPFAAIQLQKAKVPQSTLYLRCACFPGLGGQPGHCQDVYKKNQYLQQTQQRAHSVLSVSTKVSGKSFNTLPGTSLASSPRHFTELGEVQHPGQKKYFHERLGQDEFRV